MGLPGEKDSRGFYYVAYQRYEDATILLEANRTTGAMYLAGYSVECILKALILSRLPPGKRKKMMASFRGQKAHDFGWLRKQYHDAGGPTYPSTIAGSYNRVSTWRPDLRYSRGTASLKEARAFLGAAESILAWANERF